MSNKAAPASLELESYRPRGSEENERADRSARMRLPERARITIGRPDGPLVLADHPLVQYFVEAHSFSVNLLQSPPRDRSSSPCGTISAI